MDLLGLVFTILVGQRRFLYAYVPRVYHVYHSLLASYGHIRHLLDSIHEYKQRYHHLGSSCCLGCLDSIPVYTRRLLPPKNLYYRAREVPITHRCSQLIGQQREEIAVRQRRNIKRRTSLRSKLLVLCINYEHGWTVLHHQCPYHAILRRYHGHLLLPQLAMVI